MHPTRATPERVLDIVVSADRPVTRDYIREELGARTLNGVSKTVNRLLDAGLLVEDGAERVSVRPSPPARDRWWAAVTLRRAYLDDGEADLARFMADEAYRFHKRMKLEGNGTEEGAWRSSITTTDS